MKIISNLFQIVLFLSIIGGVFAITMLILSKLMRLTSHILFSILGALLFILPIIVPQVDLFPPETPIWKTGFLIASVIWLVGVVLFFLYYSGQLFFSIIKAKKYPLCENLSINQVYQECGNLLNQDTLPELHIGNFKNPAVVVPTFPPMILLNSEAVSQITHRELRIILTHELVHIQRKHHIYIIFFNLICMIHWFNPLVWIAKKDFSLACELDCDNYVLQKLSENTTPLEYGKTIIKLLELGKQIGKPTKSILGAVSFIETKLRFRQIFNKSSKLLISISVTIFSALFVLTIIYSLLMSRSIFYPYPAQIGDIEKNGEVFSPE